MAFLFGKKKGQRDGAPTAGASSAGAVTPPTNSNNSSLSNLPAGAGETGSPASSRTGHGRPPGSSDGLQQHPRGAHQGQNNEPQNPMSPQQGRMLQSPPAQVGSNASLYPWQQRRLSLNTSQRSPFPRYGHAANALSSKDGDIYVIGGLEGGQNVRHDLWMVEGGNERLEAYPVVTTSEGPGPRVGHASLLVGNAFIVFGGDTKRDEMDVLDETLYLLNTSTRQWSRATPQGNRPAGRYGHTLNIVGSKLYVFGGQVDTAFFNDLVAFDLNTLQHVASRWEIIVPEGDGDTDIPAPRTNHTVVQFNEKLYLFGGTNGEQWFNDVWSFNHRTNQWSQQDCIGFIPSPREGHAAALVGDVMYIFGGRSADGEDLGDLAAFRISTRRWYTFQNMGPSPSPRSGHSMTSVGSKIVVLGGEPSVQQDTVPEELEMVYVLDTAKIRYPDDSATPPQAAERHRAPQPRGPPPQHQAPRPPGQIEGPIQNPRLAQPQVRGSGMGANSPPGGVNPNMAGGPGGSRLPRASISVAPAGPPPTQQAPNPRVNGSPMGMRGPIQGPQNPENKLMNKPGLQGPLGPANVNGRRTPSSGQLPLKTGPIQQQPPRSSSRQHQQQGSIDSINNLSPVEETRSPQETQYPQQRPQIEVRATNDQPSIPDTLSPVKPSQTLQMRDTATSPAVDRATPLSHTQQDDFDKLKRENDWYASELALARRAGYTPQTSSSALLDDRGSNLIPDNERPFLEAMLALKGELSKVQKQVEEQSQSAAKRINDVERERDNAIQQAVYAKAKLAALGGPSSTPSPGGSRSIDIDQEKMTDMSRKLAASLSAQADLSVRVEALSQEIISEKKARHLADETAAAAQSRISELDEYRNWAGSEIENLRAELVDAGKAFRDEAALGQEAAADAKLLRIDTSELARKLDQAIAENKSLKNSLEQMTKAVQSSAAKSTMLERQLEEERTSKEALERKLAQVRAEHEERTADLSSTHQRLKEVEELLNTYKEDAEAMNLALSAGFGKLGDRPLSASISSLTDERVRVLQEHLDNTKVLLAKSKAQADETGGKLTEAMQRIAGLEYQQGQASKDSIALRRRMAEVSDEARRLKSENAELTQHVNDKQLEVDAVSAKLNALKEILHERGNASGLDKRRSVAFSSPSPVSGTATPEQISRLRELEHKLEDSLRAHRDTKNTAEMQAQEIEKHFREKLEQLEQDYQSAVHYVKGTDRIVKKMKEELTKYKSQNIRLQKELEDAQRNAGSSQDNDDWQHERESLNREIDDLRAKVREAAAALAKHISESKQQYDVLREERDQFKIQNSQLQLQNLDSNQQYTETKSLLDKLESENSLLEQRAQSAEHKVSMLLEQVETSVDAYRRSVQIPSGVGPQGSANGDITSARSSYYGPDNRTSVALDSLATELDQLRTHWESTNKTYRLSNNAFDFEKPATSPNVGSGYDNSMQGWRQKLATSQEEDEHLEAPRRGNGSGHGSAQHSPIRQTAPNGFGGPAQPSPAMAAAGSGLI